MNFEVGDLIILAAAKAVAWGAVLIWLAYIFRPVFLAWIAA
ncbi:MAG: hypothetical protein AAGL89_12830 [Pseudomonadota bacterium]